MNYADFIKSVSEKFGNVIPGALGALVVLLIGLVIANIIKRVVIAIFKSTNWTKNLLQV